MNKGFFLSYLSIRISVDVLQEAQAEHEFRVFRRPAEVGGVPVLDQLMDEREIYDGVNLAEQVVLRNDTVIKVRAVK